MCPLRFDFPAYLRRDMPFISICIPAYKRPEYLKRLLDSICVQIYTDYEVIVTDDSPDDTVEKICSLYPQIQNLRYYKNAKPLGTPANWNAAIDLANGEWIKLMHDDDWFSDSTSLQQFADCAKKNKEAVIFSAYTNVFENNKTEKVVFPEKFRLLQVQKEPAILVAKNFIGPPSVVMHRNDGRHLYDVKLKWLVDIDMYRRRIETDRLVYIARPLVKVGMGDTQVTSYTKNVGEVEMPEHFHFLNKMGIEKLKNILVYDYNWRFFRNFNIRNTGQIRQYGYAGEIHPVLRSMIDIQAKFPAYMLKLGGVSKFLMTLHFIANKHKIK